jgi:hypothetical protein
MGQMGLKMAQTRRRFGVFLAGVSMGAAILTAGLATAAAPLTQPAYERATQRTLPFSKASLWSVLRRIKITEDDRCGVFLAAFPPEARALDKQSVTPI